MWLELCQPNLCEEVAVYCALDDASDVCGDAQFVNAYANANGGRY